MEIREHFEVTDDENVANGNWVRGVLAKPRLEASFKEHDTLELRIT